MLYKTDDWIFRKKNLDQFETLWADPQDIVEDKAGEQMNREGK